MGIYIDKGNDGFSRYAKRGYIDKTGMIDYINQTIDTADMLTCVTRPRRFGKSVAAKILYAYYDRSCNSHELFQDLSISQSSSYLTYLNK